VLQLVDDVAIGLRDDGCCRAAGIEAQEVKVDLLERQSQTPEFRSEALLRLSTLNPLCNCCISLESVMLVVHQISQLSHVEL